MSGSQLDDNFSIALADVERLVEVWSDLSATQTWQFGVGYLLVLGVEALMTPRMSTPYSITIEALQRLSAFRNRITHLNIRDQFFEGIVEDLVVAVIKERAASQPLRPKDFVMSIRKPWEYRAFEALEEWLKTRDMLLTSFGAKGAVVEQLDSVIEEKAMRLLIAWDPHPHGGFVRGLELRGKLKAFPNIATSLDEELMPQTLEDQMPSQMAIEDIESSSTPEDSAEVNRMLQEKNKQLEATVDSLEQEVTGLKLARQNLDTAAETSNKHLDDLRLSYAAMSKKNTVLTEELEKVRLSHLGNREKNNELEAENATSSKRFALSNGNLQETVRKLKNEIEVLQKAVIINNDCKVYDTSYQSDGLKAKERLAEAEEDLAAMKKANKQFVTEHEDLQVELAALLRDKARLQDKAATLEECEHLKIENGLLKEWVERSHPMIRKKKEDFASANAHLTSSLSKADDHAALSKSNEKLVAEGAKKDIELKQAANLVSRLTNKIGKSKEDKARLVAGLALAAKGLRMATSTITATNIDNLMAVNLRLEEELKAANGIIGQIRSTLLPGSITVNTVNEVSAIHESPDADAAKLINLNENMKWSGEAPLDPVLTGDTESDAWSTTILTPPPGLDTPKVSYFPPIPRFDTFVADLTMKGGDGASQIGDVPNRGDIC